MFHFGTTHHHERRDGFGSFRCFWMRGGRGRGGERKNTGIGGGGLERTLRGRKRNRGGRKRDFEEEGHGNRNKMKQGFREEETLALRRRKKEIGNHVIL